MAITQPELVFYKPTAINNTGSNGGRMYTQAIALAAMNNVWPNVSQAERAAGLVTWRKVFFKVDNASNLSLIGPKIWVSKPTPGDDRVLIFPGTQTDTQATKIETRFYGCGFLDANVSAGAGSVDVNVEDPTDVIFQPGDLVCISNKTSVNDPSGTVQFVTVDTVSWNGNKATLTFAIGEELLDGYTTAQGTTVASVHTPADIATSWEAWGGSTVAGTWNGTSPATPPTTIVPVLDNIGTIYQTWTLTFTDATNFTCTGDTVGGVAGGTIGSTFAPNNPAFSRPYFTLPVTGWGGTWAATEVLTFRTIPAAVPMWWKRIVPAGAASTAADEVVVSFSGASA
ncbi:MAG: hypothetical protein HQL89_00975 [Magnetococcales bacterium]|nr:hypothetical protein [Magnetococcales bacterium]